MLAVGVNTDGYREVLGLMLGDTESEESWTEFFNWLKSRGLRGVDLISSKFGILVILRWNIVADWKILRYYWSQEFEISLKTEKGHSFKRVGVAAPPLLRPKPNFGETGAQKNDLFTAT